MRSEIGLGGSEIGRNPILDANIYFHENMTGYIVLTSADANEFIHFCSFTAACFQMEMPAFKLGLRPISDPPRPISDFNLAAFNMGSDIGRTLIQANLGC